jgi:hypothetical protein
MANGEGGDERDGGLWVVVTCMGRLAFLKRTIPTIVGERPVRYALVDFSCPDRAGDWLESTYADRVRDGTMMVVRAQGRQFFHKTAALNLGAHGAIARGARTLCFADADTAFAPGALDEMGARLAPGRFLVAGPNADGTSVPSLTGLLVVAADDFARAGGYDESFVDWGSEDIEMRLRLHLKLGLAAEPLPRSIVRAIAHGDWLRAQFHRERNLRNSAGRNWSMLQAKLVEWTGKPIDNLPESAKRLLFVGSRAVG